MQKHIYTAHPEFISKYGNEDLYKIESQISTLIMKSAELRVNKFKEDFWHQAIPQVLLNCLNSFDPACAKVASLCFLSGKEEETTRDE